MIAPARGGAPAWLPRAQVYFDPVWATAEVLASLPAGSSHGPVAAEFEKQAARALGSTRAVCLPHARVALDVILRALALPAGSEVLMTPVTIPDIVNVVLMHGLRPVFVDLGVRTCNVDCDALERAVTERTRAVLLTHLAGIPSDMDRIMPLVRRRGLELLEDCSQAMGTTWRGRTLGTFGRAGFFSLTTLKPLSTFAGGLVVTDDAALAVELRRAARALPPPPSRSLLALLARDHVLHAVSHPGLFDLATHRMVGAAERSRPGWVAELQRGNLAMWNPKRSAPKRRAALPSGLRVQYTDAQARIGLRELSGLRHGNERRRDLALLLLAALSERGVGELLRPLAPEESTFWRFPFFTRRVAELRAHLWSRRVDTSATNLPCLSREPEYEDIAAETPEAARYVEQMVFLPLHPTMGDDDMVRIADAVAEAEVS